MLNIRTVLSTVALLGVVGASSSPAQFVNPNASGGASPYSGGRVTINTIPAYGAPVYYMPPYGGNGYYAAVAPSVSGGGWTGNAPGYGGYGFAPFGYNEPLLPPMPDPIAQQQQYALNNSRYDLQTAQTARAYAEANFFQAQAMATAMNTADPLKSPVRDQFNVRTMAPKLKKRGNASPSVPLGELMTPQGIIKWPASAPDAESRDEIEQGTKILAQQFREDGKASVEAVNDTRDALYSYGLPALAEVRRTSPADAPAFKAFLNNLDSALLSMAGK